MCKVTGSTLKGVATAALVGSALFISEVPDALADTAHVVHDQAHCVTGKTRWDGRRRSCYASVEIKAPKGFAFDPQSIRFITVASAGTGAGCSNLVFHRKKIGRVTEVIWKVTGQVIARSPKRNAFAAISLGATSGLGVAAPEVMRLAAGEGAGECRLQGTYYNLAKY